MKKIQSKINPAKLLLDDIYELYTFEPDFKKWNLKNFKKNSYRYVLLKRIQSLLAALAIDYDIKKLFTGKFIVDSKIDLNHVFSKSTLLNKYALNERDLKHKIKSTHWADFFEIILKHQLLIQNVLAMNSGVLIASGIYESAVRYTNDISNAIWDIAKEEQNILVYLLNPKSKTFSINELNQQFDYPVIDMKKLYLEEL